MIEAELKAKLRDPDAVRAALDARTVGERATYRDCYYDTPTADLDREGRELRIRTISQEDGARHLLTYKGLAADAASGSKPEHEVEVSSADVAAAIVKGLGYVPLVGLTKECVNYRLCVGPRDFLATLVRVPELDGTFLEVETMAGDDDLNDAIAAVRTLMGTLGVQDSELTTELYTDAVRAARQP